MGDAEGRGQGRALPCPARRVPLVLSKARGRIPVGCRGCSSGSELPGVQAAASPKNESEKVTL